MQAERVSASQVIGRRTMLRWACLAAGGVPSFRLDRAFGATAPWPVEGDLRIIGVRPVKIRPRLPLPA